MSSNPTGSRRSRTPEETSTLLWFRFMRAKEEANNARCQEVESHYLLGIEKLKREDYSEGIKQLEKALDVGRNVIPKRYMANKIWPVLANAKYMEWECSSSKRARKLQNLKEACEKALMEEHFLEDCQDEDGSRMADRLEQIQYLQEVFRKAAIADTPMEVPDYLCCKITHHIFFDPVITRYGYTYERAWLLKHLSKVGEFDPITRGHLDEHGLVTNYAIKEAIQAYLTEYAWAYKHHLAASIPL